MLISGCGHQGPCVPAHVHVPDHSVVPLVSANALAILRVPNTDGFALGEKKFRIFCKNLGKNLRFVEFKKSIQDFIISKQRGRVIPDEPNISRERKNFLSQFLVVHFEIGILRYTYFKKVFPILALTFGFIIIKWC